jgi:hypothetical protein
MAITVTDYLAALTTYTDQLSQPLLRESVLAPTLFKYINTIEGVKNSVAINYSTSTLVIQAGGCNTTNGTINATGSFAPAQRNLDVCKLKVETAVCLEDLESYWFGMMMKAGSYGETLDPEVFAKTYVADQQAKIAAGVEDLAICGAVSGTYSSTLTQCNGLLYILDSTSATSSIVTSTWSGAGALTTANAISVVDSLINLTISQQPDILGEELIMLMGYADFQILTFALRALNQFHITWGADPNTWDFIYPGSPNIRIVATRGLNVSAIRGTIILTPRKNIAFGTDLISDSTNFTMYYDFPTKLVETRVAWKQGIQVAYPQYVIYKRK